jgi:adenine-specific DNA glycosylase
MSNLPPLPPVDPKMQIDDAFIRIIPGYSRKFVEEYARSYAEEAVRLERERSNKLADALQELLADTQHAQHPSCEDGGYCPVRDAREALEEFAAIRARSQEGMSDN